MAEGRGGYRQPRNPAPVSGPGQLSRRTDGGPQQSTQPMTGMGYGENAEFNAIQGAAPLAAAPQVSNTRARRTSPTGNGAAAAPVQLFSPTGFPEEPVTAGASFGPGPNGPMGGAPVRSSLAETLEAMLPYDDTGDISYFLDIATRRGW